MMFGDRGVVCTSATSRRRSRSWRRRTPSWRCRSRPPGRPEVPPLPHKPFSTGSARRPAQRTAPHPFVPSALQFATQDLREPHRRGCSTLSCCSWLPARYAPTNLADEVRCRGSLTVLCVCVRSTNEGRRAPKVRKWTSKMMTCPSPSFPPRHVCGESRTRTAAHACFLAFLTHFISRATLATTTGQGMGFAPSATKHGWHIQPTVA
jgi:hypothetical protein